jgi:hypothetical protein
VYASVALISDLNEFTSFLKEVGRIPERFSLRTSPTKCGYQRPKLVRLFLAKDSAVETSNKPNLVDFVNESFIDEDDNSNNHAASPLGSTYQLAAEIAAGFPFPSDEISRKSPLSGLEASPVSSGDLGPGSSQKSLHEEPQFAQADEQGHWTADEQQCFSPVSTFPNESSPNDSISLRFAGLTTTRHYPVPRLYQHLSTRLLSRREAFLLRHYVENLAPWVRFHVKFKFSKPTNYMI